MKNLPFLIAAVIVILAASPPAACGVGGSQGKDAVPYVFTLNGKPFSPDIVSLRGTPDRPQSGDLVRVDGLVLTLGPERECQGIRGVSSLDFTSGLPHLRSLDVRRSEVKDLSPLGGLGELETVKVSHSPVERLPDKAMPSLKTLEVFTTRLSDSAVAEFSKLNPGCTVDFRWEAALRRDLAGATRIRLRSGGTCHRKIAEEKTLLEVSGADKVCELLGRIHIDESKGPSGCMCWGKISRQLSREGPLPL